MPSMQLVHPAFGTGPTFYMPPATLVRGPEDMLSSPLRQHILDYEPPRGFVIPAFVTFDYCIDPYDHMLHYSQAMILNAGNDRLLCKVFPASLRGPALAWFPKVTHNSIILFNELWAEFVSQYLCSVRKKRTGPYKLFSSRKGSLFKTLQGNLAKSFNRYSHIAWIQSSKTLGEALGHLLLSSSHYL